MPMSTIENLQDMMFRACENNDVPMMKRALNSGADPGAVDRTGFSFVHLATENCADDVALLLIERGAPIDSADTREDKPLIISAVQHRCVRTLEALISRGVNVNTRDTDGKSAIDYIDLSQARPGKQAQRQRAHLQMSAMLRSAGGV